MTRNAHYSERYLAQEIIKTAGNGMVPNFIQFEKNYEIDNYPYGREHTKAVFKVDTQGDNKERVERITIDPKTGRINKPRYTVFATSAILGISADNKVYPITGEVGQITIWSSDLQYSVASIFTSDPDYTKLAEALNMVKIKVTIKKTPTSCEIYGLQDKSMNTRVILELSGITPEQINDIKIINKDEQKREWKVLFKSKQEVFNIFIRS